MKCPLLLAPKKNTIEARSSRWTDCLKEECAWWLKDFNLCAIKDLALELRILQLRVADIIHPMPEKKEK